MVVEPNVSTPSKVLTKTFFLASFLAVIVNNIVTVIGKPCGIFATITIMKPCTKVVKMFSPLAIPITNNVVAVTKEMITINFTNKFTSLCKVVSVP